MSDLDFFGGSSERGDLDFFPTLERRRLHARKRKLGPRVFVPLPQEFDSWLASLPADEARTVTQLVADLDAWPIDDVTLEPERSDRDVRRCHLCRVVLDGDHVEANGLHWCVDLVECKFRSRLRLGFGKDRALELKDVDLRAGGEEGPAA